MGKRRGGGGTKEKRRKRVTVKLIPRKHAGEVTEPWALMEEIRAAHHPHLADVKVAMAWRLGWRPDADGVLCLGRCRKRGDLDRELDSFDFVILLNKDAWQTLNTNERRALIDHELCHATVVIDADDNPKLDDQDRLVCRIRKHDVEEFKAVTERHGLWTSHLAELAQAAINDAQRPLLAEAEKSADQSDGDGSDKAADGAWKRWNVHVLASFGLPAGKVKLLEEAGLTTMGRLVAAINKGEEGNYLWWSEIKGFGEGGYDRLVDAMMRLREAKPEFQAGHES